MMLRWDGNDAPSPSKAARTILTAPNQVKIASQPSSLLILLDLFELSPVRSEPAAALQQLDAQSIEECLSVAASLTNT